MVFCHSPALGVLLEDRQWALKGSKTLASSSKGLKQELSLVKMAPNAQGDVIPWQCVQIRASEAPRVKET